MKLLRKILFPVVPIYYLITWLRNRLYDKGIKSSKSYDFPVICVGNLSTGGTGKTPMIEYLIRLLKDEKFIATLSRGYKRITEGFVFADESATADTIGDEPFQFYRKFEDITVAVDGDRQNGIAQLSSLNPNPEVILLDDAYQHRKVKAGYNILLTAYNNLFYKDIVLPTGNLREPRAGYKRADVIVVTKCPKDLSASEKEQIKRQIKPLPNQEVFFSVIGYNDEGVSKHNTKVLKTLPKFTLVTGIANAKPLVDYLKGLNLEFNHLEFPDHYSFTEKDILELDKQHLILTTEKDFVRLSLYESLEDKLYYLPIQLQIDRAEAFNKMVKAYARN